MRPSAFGFVCCTMTCKRTLRQDLRWWCLLETTCCVLRLFGFGGVLWFWEYCDGTILGFLYILWTMRWFKSIMCERILCSSERCNLYNIHLFISEIYERKSTNIWKYGFILYVFVERGKWRRYFCIYIRTSNKPPISLKLTIYAILSCKTKTRR